LNASVASVKLRRLANHRCDYQFLLVVDDGPSWQPTLMRTVVSSSPVLVQDGKNSPQFLHLEPLGHGKDGLRVHWIQGQGRGADGEGTCGDRPAHVELWATQGGESDSVRFPARSSTYDRTDLCGPPATIEIQSLWRDPGCFHEAVLESLVPLRRYAYRVGIEGEEWSAPREFVAPPPVGAQHNLTTKVVFFADQAYNDDPPIRSFRTSELVAEDVRGDFGASLVLHGGDLSYSMGFSWAWDHWGDMVSQYAAHVPYAVSGGNHEIDGPSSYSPPWGNFNDDSGGECGVPTVQRFALLRERYFYSFAHGSVHVVVLCTEVDLSPGSEQHDWLERDLRAVDRQVTPWVIVTGHRPPMASFTPDTGGKARSVTEHLHEFLAPLLAKYRVTLGLWGHFHHYERFRATATGTTNLIVGTAGADLDSGVAWDDDSVAHIEDWGYLRLSFERTAVRGQFVLNRDRSVFDSFVIKSN
jgi:acid phosphatase type 7